MSKKTTIIGIVVLVLGAVAVPGGIFASDYIRTLVHEGIPESLLDIQEGVIEDAEDTVATLAIPEVILGVKAEADAALPDIVNGGTAAYIINGTVYASFNPPLSFFPDLTTALEYFFNDPVYNQTTTMGFLNLLGVSEYFMGGMLGNLSYTPAAQQALMLTGITVSTPLYNRTIPGIMMDTTFGFGVLYFLEAYQAAATLVPGVNASMLSGYGVTWDQLSIMADYLSTYMIGVVVYGYYLSLGTSVAEVAMLLFYDQWANASLGQIDLSLLSDLITDPVVGLEAGYPTPTGITLGTSIDMFNDTLPYAFTNDMGIMVWAAAALNATGPEAVLLVSTFGINPTQLGLVLNWLFNVFKTDVVPPLILASEGLTMWELTNVRLFLPQWANGTYFPTGLDLTGIPNKGEGWEIGVVNNVQTPSGITVSSSVLLFTETNALSLVNDDGIERWYAAKVNDSDYVALRAGNLLTDAQMLLLLDYVPYFRDNVVPYLAEYKYDLPTDAYTLADGLLYGLMIPGIALLALGGVALVISIIKRKS
jgi:hypothetical protein